MKKIFSIIFLILVCSISFAQQDMYSIGKRTQANPYVSKFEATFENMEYILSTPYVDTAYKIYDYANVLPESKRREIRRRCQEFINKTGLGIAIVIVNGVDHPTFNRFSPQETFIQDFYDYNDFKWNGVMMLLNIAPEATKHHSIYDAGSLHEWDFIGSRREDYGPEMKARYNSGNYYGDIMWFIEHVEEDYLYDISFPFWKCLIFAVIFGLIFWGAHLSKYKLKHIATSANNYKKANSFKLTQNRTDFVRTFTTKTYSPKSSGSSHGGRGSSGGGHSGGSF